MAIMPSGQFKDITPPDYKGKHIVFFFYPLDLTFVRPTETTAFRDRTEEFKKLTKSGHLGGSAVECLPLAQGLIPEFRIKSCIWFLAGSLLLPLPVSLPLSVSLMNK